MFDFHDINWIRAYTKKNQLKNHRINVNRNYKRVYKEIKRRAKMGCSKVIVRFRIYEENIERLQFEGYEVEKDNTKLSIGW